jgi:hypothetical protein
VVVGEVDEGAADGGAVAVVLETHLLAVCMRVCVCERERERRQVS